MRPHRSRRKEAGGGETEAMTHRWHRTQSLDHHWKVTHSDDWTLVDSETGEFLARIFGQEDLACGAGGSPIPSNRQRGWRSDWG
jgi:hypothetical protein